MTNPNNELLLWAVENIKEWNDDYTHLRSDDSRSSVFYTSGPWYVNDEYNRWNGLGDAEWERADEKFSTYIPKVITKQEWSNGVAAKNAPTSSSEGHTGHGHAELYQELAEVAKVNHAPWREFQILHQGTWMECTRTQCFAEVRQYRRKPTPPKTMNIGGIVVEAWPLEELEDGEKYWTIVICGGYFYPEGYTYEVSCYSKARVRLGKAFSTKEQAQAVADALNKVYNDALVGWKAEPSLGE